MRIKYRNYSDEDIIYHSKQVKSMCSLLKALNLKPAGGNHANMHRNIQRLNIDNSHWTKQGWNNGKQLKDFSNYLKGRPIKKHLIKKRGHKCEGENCGITEWRGLPVMLELEHKDGNRTNNQETNLELLCPNCHSQTSTWRGRKNKVIWSSTWI